MDGVLLLGHTLPQPGQVLLHAAGVGPVRCCELLPFLVEKAAHLFGQLVGNVGNLSGVVPRSPHGDLVVRLQSCGEGLSAIRLMVYKRWRLGQKRLAPSGAASWGRHF